MYTSKLKIKTSSVNAWMSLCWWLDLSDCSITSSISQGWPQKKPADHNCWDDGWQSEDVAFDTDDDTVAFEHSAEMALALDVVHPEGKGYCCTEQFADSSIHAVGSFCIPWTKGDHHSANPGDWRSWEIWH